MRKKISKIFTISVCTILSIFLILSLVTSCGAVELAATRVPQEQINFPAKLGVTIITLAHPCGIAVADGIEKEAKVQDFEYTIHDADWSTEIQISQIEALIRKNPDVIIVYPIDSGAIASTCKRAEEKGIIVITIQSDSAYPTSCYLAWDFYRGARAAAKKLAEQLDGKGKVALIGSMPGDPNGELRVQGYREILADYPGIEIVATQYGDWQRKKTKDVTESLLARYPDIDAIACVDDGMAMGAIAAVKAAGLPLGTGPDEIRVWGLDGWKEAKDAIQEGELAGTVCANYFTTGVMAVDFARALLNGGIRGGQVQLAWKTPFTLVTKSNLDQVPEEAWME